MVVSDEGAHRRTAATAAPKARRRLHVTAVVALLLGWGVALLAVVPVSYATPLAPGTALGSSHRTQDAQPPETVVTFTFDGTFKGQSRAAKVLAAQDFPGTFYINSGYLEFPAYLSVDQLRGIARAGHEIGGASLYGNDLSRQSYSRSKQEVCDDRSTLAQLGNQVTSFAYPHGADTAGQVRSVVKACGYNSGRDVAGLYVSSDVCSSCPQAEKLPPEDDFSVRSVSPGLGPAALRERVERAERGGGWVPLLFDRVCTCPDKVAAGEATTPKDFEEFVQWLADRPDSTRVRTVDQVMGGELQPVVGTPLARLVPDPSPAIGSPASSADDDSPWAFLGAGTGRNQTLGIGALVLLGVVAALMGARTANRRASPAPPGSTGPSPSRRRP